MTNNLDGEERLQVAVCFGSNGNVSDRLKSMLSGALLRVASIMYPKSSSCQCRATF